jgi:hypothetical protein
MALNTHHVDEFLRLSMQTMDAMKLHQRPHSIYNLDERGLAVLEIKSRWLLKAIRQFPLLLTERKGKPWQ